MKCSPTWALALLAALSQLACLTPPAVLPSPHVDAELAVELYPPGTQPVELPLGEGGALRGLFVPAGPDAPVVLHLLESSGSAVTIGYHYEVLTRQLQGLGLASLLVDYAGVGGSDGERSPRNLERDAELLWAAAVERAGGDPGRVVLRGISLGSLATAYLLRAGAQPGAVLLHVPVLGDSAVPRFAERQHGAFVATLASWLYRDTADVDLIEALASAPSELLVYGGTQDFFLNAAEREALAAAVEAVGGRWIEQAGGHAQGTIEAHALRPDELELLIERFPREPLGADALDELLVALGERAGAGAAARFDAAAARQRLAELARWAQGADPALLAAVALGNEPDLDSLRYLWLLAERGDLVGLDFDVLVDMASLEDPSGRLSIDVIAEASVLGDMHDRFGKGSAAWNVERIVGRVVRGLEGSEERTTYSIDVSWDQVELVSSPGQVLAELRALGVPEGELARVAVRTLLKSERIPERVRSSEDGEVVLEIHEEGTWTYLDVHTQPAVRTAGGSLPRPLGRRALALRDARDERTGQVSGVPALQFEFGGVRLQSPPVEASGPEPRD